MKPMRRIELLRRVMGKPLVIVSAELGVSTALLSFWENHATPETVNEKFQPLLAEYFGEDVDSLFSVVTIEDVRRAA